MSALAITGLCLGCAIAGFVLGVIVMAMLPDDEPPTDFHRWGP